MLQEAFRTEGTLALFLVFGPYVYSYVDANFFSMLTRITLFPYLLFRFRTLIIEKMNYKKAFTCATYFLALITLGTPIIYFIGGIYPYLVVSGLGYLSCGGVLLMEKRLNLVIRIIGSVFLILGSLSLYEVSYYPLEVNVLKSTVESMPFYTFMQLSMILLLLLLSYCFFTTTKKQYNGANNSECP